MKTQSNERKIAEKEIIDYGKVRFILGFFVFVYQRFIRLSSFK